MEQNLKERQENDEQTFRIVVTSEVGEGIDHF